MGDHVQILVEFKLLLAVLEAQNRGVRTAFGVGRTRAAHDEKRSFFALLDSGSNRAQQPNFRGISRFKNSSRKSNSQLLVGASTRSTDEVFSQLTWF